MRLVFVAMFLFSVLMQGISAVSADLEERATDASWRNKIIDSARGIYPLALESNQEAQLGFSMYVLMMIEGKVVVPERSEWESQARKWLLELVRSDKDPRIAFNAAELLPGIVKSNSLGFWSSSRAIQCWQSVQDCWANVVEGKVKGSQCVALVDQAQSC